MFCRARLPRLALPASVSPATEFRAGRALNGRWAGQGVATRAMNATFHWTSRVRLAPYPHHPDLYDLGVRYDEVESEQFFKHVHVPEVLKPYLEKPISGFQLETLDTRGPACGALRGSPTYAVVAVETDDGERVYHLPAEWARHRRKCSVGVLLVAALAVTVAALHVPYAAVMDFILGAAGMALWDSRKSMASKAFWVGLQLGAPVAFDERRLSARGTRLETSQEPTHDDVVRARHRAAEQGVTFPTLQKSD